MKKKKKKILIVDDEIRIRKFVARCIEEKEYEILEGENGHEAIEIFENERENINLIILDVMMPKMDGWQVVKKIREVSRVPIIMLTAIAEEREELRGFNLGVDEYIFKPFNPNILKARVQAVLNRINGGEKIVEDYGGIRFIPTERKILIEEDEVEFSYKEYELLNYLIKNEGLALSRDTILSNVWDCSYYGDSRTVDCHIKKIRKKLNSKKEYIKTIRGLGYKFEI